MKKIFIVEPEAHKVIKLIEDTITKYHTGELFGRTSIHIIAGILNNADIDKVEDEFISLMSKTGEA